MPTPNNKDSLSTFVEEKNIKLTNICNGFGIDHSCCYFGHDLHDFFTTALSEYKEVIKKEIIKGLPEKDYCPAINGDLDWPSLRNIICEDIGML